MTSIQPVPPNRLSTKEIIIAIFGVLLTVALCVAAIYYREDIINLDVAKRYGLLGVLVIAFIAASTFSVTAIPVPYWIVTFVSPTILAPEYGLWAPVWVGLLSGLGASGGQFLTFLIGYGGRSFSRKVSSRFSPKIYERIVNWVKKRGGWAIFLMSVMANPLHLPMTLAFAAFKYPPMLFLLFTFMGTLIKSLVLAFAGYFGLNTLYELMSEGISTITLILSGAVLAALIIIVGLWQLWVLRRETVDKNTKYKAACEAAQNCGKPVLVVGGPWGTRAGRRLLKKPAHGTGDVCLDIDFRALTGHPCPVVASATNIPFKDKAFGSVFMSHVLEHLPTVEAARQAIEEMNRVADEVFIVYPSRQSIGGWLTPGHHLWVWQEGNRIFLRQRGGKDGKETIVVETGVKKQP